jgi:hypothetical protein
MLKENQSKLSLKAYEILLRFDPTNFLYQNRLGNNCETCIFSRSDLSAP